MIENGSEVAIEFTLKLDDDTVIDSNVGKEPLVYIQGEQKILPAIQKELEGLDENDTTNVTLEPTEAFGEIDPEAFEEVDVSQVPEEARKENTLLRAKDDGGNERMFRVHEVHDDKIVIDCNHPLAGKTLHFDIKVVSIS
ncbi:MAG TPA: FKBP-type peptidyl-prolyl cis-trans isomerase [Gammaproteobacteria bacterium]|nr:FKBP-type peptidyl-prolyl cis-trans isomerase [Gammaproteobacteria bacterium]